MAKRPPKFDATLKTVTLPTAEEQNAKIIAKAIKRGAPCYQWVCDDDCLRTFRGILLPYEIQVARHAEKKDWIVLLGVALNRKLKGWVDVIGPGDWIIIDDVGDGHPAIGVVRVPADKRMAN